MSRSTECDPVRVLNWLLFVRCEDKHGEVRVILMSLNKAVASRKEYRKPYHGSKVFDKTCRNHGGCPWCEENRKFKFRDKHPDDKGEYEDEDGNDDDP